MRAAAFAVVLALCVSGAALAQTSGNKKSGFWPTRGAVDARDAEEQAAADSAAAAAAATAMAVQDAADAAAESDPAQQAADAAAYAADVDEPGRRPGAADPRVRRPGESEDDHRVRAYSGYDHSLAAAMARWQSLGAPDDLRWAPVLEDTKGESYWIDMRTAKPSTGIVWVRAQEGTSYTRTRIQVNCDGSTYSILNFQEFVNDELTYQSPAPKLNKPVSPGSVAEGLQDYICPR